MTQIEKAKELIGTFATGDAQKAASLLAEGYIQHNLAYGTGRDAFVGSVNYLASAPVKTTVKYFDGDIYIQHNTGIADGLSGLGAALAALAKQNIQMIYTTVHQVLAQGNYVLAVSEGTFGGAPTSYYDLWRVENGKIAEHWDVMETIADKESWQNANGKF